MFLNEFIKINKVIDEGVLHYFFLYAFSICDVFSMKLMFPLTISNLGYKFRKKKVKF